MGLHTIAVPLGDLACIILFLPLSSALQKNYVVQLPWFVRRATVPDGHILFYTAALKHFVQVADNNTKHFLLEKRLAFLL
jgi:hypothetical protein